MSTLETLLERNKEWAARHKESDPVYFEKLAETQTPEYLWIGCSDSRLTPTSSLGLRPGKMFVHRNIANLVGHTDMNILAVLQFAVEVLQVNDVIVCGHYGCGGVRAALDDSRLGLIDNWLRNIRDTMIENQAVLANAPSDDERFAMVCRMNVMRQVRNVSETTVVKEAWERGQKLTVHGWIYSIADGIYHDLECSISSNEELHALQATQ